MRRVTATNALTAATILAGFAVAAAAATGHEQAEGIALGVAVAMGALLIRFVARDLNRASQRHLTSLNAVELRLDSVADRVTRSKRKLDRRIEILDARVARESSKMTLRILGDINAARVEQVADSDN